MISINNKSLERHKHWNCSKFSFWNASCDSCVECLLSMHIYTVALKQVDGKITLHYAPYCAVAFCYTWASVTVWHESYGYDIKLYPHRVKFYRIGCLVGWAPFPFCCWHKLTFLCWRAVKDSINQSINQSINLSEINLAEVFVLHVPNSAMHWTNSKVSFANLDALKF